MAHTRNLTKELLNKIRTNKIEVSKNSFKISLNSKFAEIKFTKQGNIYDLKHTNIPDDYQGHGLGNVLAERIFDHIISTKSGVKLKLTCEFLQHFYSKNTTKYCKNIVSQ